METKAPGGAAARYQAALKQGRFLIQRCNDCGERQVAGAKTAIVNGNGGVAASSQSTAILASAEALQIHYPLGRIFSKCMKHTK